MAELSRLMRRNGKGIIRKRKRLLAVVVIWLLQYQVSRQMGQSAKSIHLVAFCQMFSKTWEAVTKAHLLSRSKV